MNSSIRIGSSITLPIYSSLKLTGSSNSKIRIGLRSSEIACTPKLHALRSDGSVSSSASTGAAASSAGDSQRRRSSLESLFCYDKPVPEERIEKPVGVSIEEKAIGNNPRCTCCEAKGAVLCTTCAGSGLYVDSILESQGIIVKVRCLGCGGTGNIMCSECGGRGHL